MSDLLTGHDWTKHQSHADKLTFEQVDPATLAHRAPLTGVVRSGSSLTWQYYSDTRASGTLMVDGTDWDGTSAIRITHSIPDWGFTRVLGTFLVTADDLTWSHGRWQGSMELHSMLYALSTDLMVGGWSVGVGGRALDVVSQVCSTCGRPYTELSSANDHIYTSAATWDIGKSYLSVLEDVCDTASDRMDVAADGHVTCGPYAVPSGKTPAYALDAGGPLVYGDVSYSSDALSTPGRVIVDYTDSSSNHITAFSDASASSASSSARRGYMVSELQSVSDLSPATATAAQALADSYLASDGTSDDEWTVQQHYVPLTEGDVVTLTVDGTAHKTLVKEVDLDLKAGLLMKTTYKGV